MVINSSRFPSNLALAVDTVVFGYAEGQLSILLIERGVEPFKGTWALPGGFVLENENLEKAALRELSEEAGVEIAYLEQLYTFGEPKRDPRFRVISVCYFALVRIDKHQLLAGSDANKAKWFSIDKIPNLAFDHLEIIQKALARLQSKAQYEPIVFNLLPTEFTLFQLQEIFEAILYKKLDKRNFRKKILSYGFLKEGQKFKNVDYRYPSLYKFVKAKYERMKKRGEYFAL